MAETLRKDDLKILKYIAKKEKVGFTKILQFAKLSRSALDRRLKALVRDGYIIKIREGRPRYIVTAAAYSELNIALPANKRILVFLVDKQGKITNTEQ